MFYMLYSKFYIPRISFRAQILQELKRNYIALAKIAKIARV